MAEAEKRRMPVRTSDIEMDAPYDGWEATVRINMPVKEYDRMFDPETRYEAMGEAIIRWNFVDDDGDPIPPNADGVQELGFDLLRMLLEKIDKAVANPLAGTS
jgi:hypothetical protein